MVDVYGAIIVSSWLTGQVLDMEILSRHCQECKMTVYQMKTSRNGIVFMRSIAS